jgi:hypothetical protein
MAVVVTRPVGELFDSNVTDNSGGYTLLAAALNNDPEAARLFAARPFTFVTEGQNVGNEAVTIALLAPVNLTLLGVAFPASSQRTIRTRVWSRRATVANCGYVEKVWTVIGGTTPSVAPDITVAAALAAVNEPSVVAATPNNNSASAPEYGTGIVIMDAVATTNVIVGVQNLLGTTRAATSATLLRWRLEVIVDPLVILPVAA